MTQSIAPFGVTSTAPVPQPVVVMMARHLQAAMLHLGRWRALGENAKAILEQPRLGEKASGPAVPVLAAEHEAFGIWHRRQPAQGPGLPVVLDEDLAWLSPLVSARWQAQWDPRRRR